MSSSQSPPNAGYPGQPGPAGNYEQSYPPPPPLGFVPPPPPPPPPQKEESYSGQNPAPPSSGIYSISYPEDPTRDEAKGFDFSEKSIRLGFIRKVYLLLMSQLLLTFGIILFITFHPATNLYVGQNIAVFFGVAFIVSFVILICIVCCSSVRRKTPMNFIFLFIFTGAEGLFVGVITTAFRSETILLAFGITIVLCFSLTLFAFQTKWDFTGLNAALFVLVIVFISFAFLAPFFEILRIVYGILMAIIFSFFLILDTQLMMGGKYTYSISPEEYVFATLNIYLDIINIFLHILSAFAN